MGAYLENLGRGKWSLRVSIGSGASRRRFSRRFTGGKREALAALRDFEVECLERPVASHNLPEYMRGFSSSRLSAGLISENTHQQYMWASRVLDCCLDYPIGDISAEDVRGALARIGSGATPSGRALSPRSVSNLVRCGRVVFDEAMRARLAASNPFRGVVVPPAKKERRALDMGGAAGLLDRLPSDNAGAFAASLILRSGLRASEALGLCWGDLDAGGLHVRRAITKTDAGARFVPLSVDDMEYIDERRQYLERVCRSAGGMLLPSDRLCCSNDGRPLSYNALRLWWERNRERLGVGDMVLHELRHTYLTNLAQAGVHPSVMQRLAGHSSMSVTMEIYTHVNNSDLRDAVASLYSARDKEKNEGKAGADLGAFLQNTC